MATFRKRNGKWQVQVRRTAHGSLSRTFTLKTDARTWAHRAEAELESGRHPAAALDRITLADILVRYRDEVVCHKKARDTETRRLSRLLKDPLSALTLAQLSARHMAAFRERRLKDGVRTCQYDLVLIRHALRIAATEWGLALPVNPVDQIRKPRPPRPRERRLTAPEKNALEISCRKGQTPWIWPLITVALETAMRRGELLALRWENIDFCTAVAFLPVTKNGDCRRMPLSPRALGVLGGMPRHGDRVFNVSESAVRQAWDRVCRRAAISGLHFHDLRHEAISRLFETGLNVPEVALISGHRTPAQLFRYTQMRVRDVQRKLAEAEAETAPPALRLVKS